MPSAQRLVAASKLIFWHTQERHLTDKKRYFVSEATVYRLLKAHDLITSPAFVVIKAADEFRDKTTRPNEMWQPQRRRVHHVCT